MYLRSRMSVHSYFSDTNDEDESHAALHSRCTDSNAATVLSTSSGTTIYSVTLHRSASIVRQYQKRILNQHRLMYRGDICLFLYF
jgi:hypothetical protein